MISYLRQHLICFHAIFYGLDLGILIIYPLLMHSGFIVLIVEAFPLDHSDWKVPSSITYYLGSFQFPHFQGYCLTRDTSAWFRWFLAFLGHLLLS